MATTEPLPAGEFFVVSDYGHGDGSCSEGMSAGEALAEYTRRRFGQTPEQRMVGGLGWSGLTYPLARQFADARHRGTHSISDRDRSGDFTAEAFHNG